MIWVPSVSGAARFSASSRAPERAPPAASMASITRAPSVNSYTPGRRTQPATSTRTTTSGEGLADAGADAVPPLGAVATSTGRGSDRTYQRPAPPRVTARSATSPTSSPRERAARRSRSGPSEMPPPTGGGRRSTLASAGRPDREVVHIGRDRTILTNDGGRCPRGGGAHLRLTRL